MPATMNTPILSTNASRWAVAALAVIVGLTLSCGLFQNGADEPPPQKKTAKAEVVRRIIPARDWGKPAVCATTGKLFDLNEASGAAELRSQTYLFIDELALQAFLADPDQFLLDPPHDPPIPSPASK